MKLFTKYLLFICSILAAKYNYAQSYTYIPMPDSAAIWNGLIEGEEDGLHYVQYSYSCGIQGDTLINGLIYSSISESNTFLYGMRQDTSKKVYIIYRNPSTGLQTTDTFEHLMYDFSMQVGDSFYDSVYRYRPTVMAIDTISTPGGLRKRFTISDKASIDSNQYDQWIEGVGSLKILANARLDFFEVGYCLSNLTVNGQMVYQDTLACHFVLNGINDIPENSISLSPNPATHSLYIRSKQNNISDLYLSDLNGQKLKEEAVIDNITATIDLSPLASGLYLITIKDIDGNVTTKKFVKE